MHLILFIYVGEGVEFIITKTFHPVQQKLPTTQEGNFYAILFYMLNYRIKKSSKAKRVSIQIDQNRQVTLTMPALFPEYLAKQFIDQKQAWIEEKLATIPNIPKFIDYFEQDNNYYLVQEYIEGEPLSDFSVIISLMKRRLCGFYIHF